MKLMSKNSQSWHHQGYRNMTVRHKSITNYRKLDTQSYSSLVKPYSHRYFCTNPKQGENADSNPDDKTANDEHPDAEKEQENDSHDPELSKYIYN